VTTCRWRDRYAAAKVQDGDSAESTSGEKVSMTEQGSAGDLSANDQGPADQPAETLDRERDISILQSLENEMNEVQAALDRLEEGTYGRCEICGRPIGDERLEATPAARCCIEHERAT
jgi:DnaK suppressor protein